ncbi:MAG: hypothetical protein E6J77_25230 [Deltaproteobacteria bacterium]|nr:MAG: hypothetical protein E6J77_25230 [Deltaproteobacteria bacterium]
MLAPADGLRVGEQRHGGQADHQGDRTRERHIDRSTGQLRDRAPVLPDEHDAHTVDEAHREGQADCDQQERNDAQREQADERDQQCQDRGRQGTEPQDGPSGGLRKIAVDAVEEQDGRYQENQGHPTEGQNGQTAGGETRRQEQRPTTGPGGDRTDYRCRAEEGAQAEGGQRAPAHGSGFGVPAQCRQPACSA